MSSISKVAMPSLRVAGLASMCLWMAGCVGAPRLAPLDTNSRPMSAPVGGRYLNAPASGADADAYGERISPSVQDLTDHIRCEIVETYYDHVYLPELDRQFNPSSYMQRAPLQNPAEPSSHRPRHA
jgi:hypothetical protein